MRAMTEIDPVEADRLAREGIENAYFKAPEQWKRLAWEAIRECAGSFTNFTADIFWLRLEALCRRDGFDFDSINKDASGSVFKSAARAGIIKKTDRVVVSMRRAAHKKPLPLWESVARRSMQQ